MIATIIISILTCASLILSILFFPKIKIANKEISTYWLICVIGAILMLSFNLVSFNNVIDEFFSSSSINPLKILILFFSMTFLSIFLDEVGFFRFLASFLILKCKTNQKSLFLLMYVMVAILTIFTSNDIVILTFTPFICYFAKNANINPIPFLVAEFAAANTYSMMLIIGNPTNIFLATSINIDFINYLKVMFLPTILAGIAQLLILLVIFNHNLKKEIKVDVEVKKVKSKLDLVMGLGHLTICLLLLVVSSYINISMWIVCLICALSLLISILSIHLIRHKKLKIIFKTLKRLPYELIPFVLSMFIIVLALKQQGITSYISDILGEENVILRYGITSFFACNLINNIPMSVLFANIPNMVDTTLYLKSIYSIIIGSNIGAFLTPIGALAGIMFTDLLNRQQVEYSFTRFIKYGMIIAIPTLLVALITLNFMI